MRQIVILVYDQVYCSRKPGNYNLLGFLPSVPARVELVQYKRGLNLLVTSYIFIINTLRPVQDDHHFADDISKCIFVNEYLILIKFSLKFVRKVPIKRLTSIGSDNGLAANRRQTIIWNNDGSVYWRMYASLGFNDLISFGDKLHFHL